MAIKVMQIGEINVPCEQDKSKRNICSIKQIPYILESNPHPFYSFRGLKNQMRIRFAVESRILEK